MIPAIDILTPLDSLPESGGHLADQDGEATVLLLHSIGLNGRSFAALRAALPQRWQLLTMDMRGHGRSAALPLSPAFTRYVDDVVSAIDRHRAVMNRPSTLHLVGHSMGGAIAASVAARCHDIASLTVIASPPAGFPAFTERANAIRANGMVAAIPATLARWFGDDVDDALTSCGPFATAYRYAQAALHELSADAFASAWDALAAFPGYEALLVDLPRTLLVMGDADLSTPPKVMASIANAFTAHGRSAALTTHTIAAAGHMLPLTHAHDIAPLLQAHWLGADDVVTDQSNIMEGGSK